MLQCLPITWYLACDTQLYIFAPLIVLPLYNNPKLGLKLWTGAMVASTGLIAYLANSYKLPLDSVYATLEDAKAMEEAGVDEFISFYQRPHMRIQPYLIGILIGWILFKLRGQELKIPKLLNVSLWVLSLSITTYLTFYTYWHRSHRTYTRTEAVLSWSISRIVWSFAISWITVSCVKGYGGIFNTILCWPPFISLAKINFFTYIFHPEVLTIIVSSIANTYQTAHQRAVSDLFCHYFQKMT